MADLARTNARAAGQVLEKKHARMVRRMVRTIAERGLKDIAGYFAAPGEEGYNPDATTEWKNRTARMELGKEVYKQVMANSREATRGAVALGIVMVQERMKASDWERKAAELDKPPAIDVDAEVVP